LKEKDTPHFLSYFLSTIMKFHINFFMRMSFKNEKHLSDYRLDKSEKTPFVVVFDIPPNPVKSDEDIEDLKILAENKTGLFPEISRLILHCSGRPGRWGN